MTDSSEALAARVCASAFSNETGGLCESLCIRAFSSLEAGITGGRLFFLGCITRSE